MRASGQAKSKKSDALVAAPVVKFGTFVAALDDQGGRVKLSYDDADAIVGDLRNKATYITKRIFDAVANADCCKKVHLSIADPAKYPSIPPSPSLSPAGVVTGTNLPEILLEVDEFTCLVRSSFTVCVDDDSFGLIADNDLDLHSKVWTRIILAGHVGSDEPDKLWRDRKAQEFFKLLSRMEKPVQAIAVEAYEEALKRQRSEIDTLDVTHHMCFAGYGVSRNAFNKVVKPLPKSDMISFRKGTSWRAEGKTLESASLNSLTKLADTFFTSSVPSGSKTITQVIDRANDKARAGREYNVVAVDDDHGIRGIFLSEANNDRSVFVGVAGDQATEFPKVNLRSPLEEIEEDEETPEIFKPSHSPSNRTLTILAVDIASGL
ncbi:MAG: hypothetical protein AAF250_10800 [Pseudomonadota bacterium]